MKNWTIRKPWYMQIVASDKTRILSFDVNLMQVFRYEHLVYLIAYVRTWNYPYRCL